MSPAFAELKPGTTKSFSATVANAKDTSVTWSIEEGSAGGEITSDGLYTAPNVDGDYHIIATSNEDTTKSATAMVSVAASIFSETGSLITGRLGHTATLLLDDQVIIAGGQDVDGKFVQNPELYNPPSDTFSQMEGTIDRAGNTATRLANGDVLFAGGVDNTYTYNPVSSAQILRADTGLIEATGSMVTPRAGHAATLLQDGRVLVTGGIDTTGHETSSAEVYNPASGTFSQAASMQSAHAGHTGILLSSGKVLITGDGSPSELYDPTADTFTVTASQPAYRVDITVTALADGRVLLTGGDFGYSGMYTGPSDIFDPVTEQFTTTGALNTPRWWHTATLLPDGTVLITGGDLHDSWDDVLATNSTEIYDPATGVFRAGPPMLFTRFGHTATLLADGRVLIVGGGDDPASGTAELYQ